MCKLESIEHDYIRILKSQSYKQMQSKLRKDSVGPGIRGSIPTRGNIILSFITLIYTILPDLTE